MNNISKICLLTLVSVFSGCALFSPDYQQPEIVPPSTTRNGTPIESAVQDLAEFQWWKKLNDPVLNKLITDGLVNNNQVQIAVGNIMQAKADLSAAEYAWIPSLSGTVGGFSGSSFGTNLTPQGALAGRAPSGNLANTNFNGYYGGFMPSYSFNVFQNISRTKMAKATLDMQKAAINATKLTLIGQISGDYFMLLGQKKQLILQQQMIVDLQSLRKLQHVVVQNGAADSSNLAIIDQEIASYQSKIPTIQNSISNSENAIQLLLNNNPGAINTKTDIDDISVDGLIPTNLSSGILKNRPDIIEAEANLRVAHANIEVANSVFFPNISLTGFVLGDSIALSNLLNTTGGLWGGLATAGMPIINAAAFEDVKAAKGGYHVAYYNYMQTVKSAFADVDNSLTNQQKMNEMYKLTLKSTQAATEYYQISLNKYNAGDKDYRTVVEAKLNLDSALLSQNQAKMQQLDAIVTVYQSLAGGYAAESESTLKAESSVK